MSTGTKKRIMLAGGGTAGHVNPLLAVADALVARDPDVEVIALGTAVGLEAELVPQAGYRLETIEKVPFPRRPDLDALRFPMRWRRETAKVRALIEADDVDVVVGFGGYASAPAYAAAHRMGVPIVIHEQNARAGMANRLGARWASFIGTAYDGTGLKAADGGEVERVGLPLRPAIASLARAMQSDRAKVRRESAAELGLDPQRPIVVVTGGSLGAVSLNRAVAEASGTLLERAQIVHLTGKGKIDEVRALVERHAGPDAFTGLGERSEPGRGYHAAQYLERIDKAFGCADLIICRSGAGSVSELTALGLPAVYVPLPIGNGEQRFNAQPVVDAGGGLLVADGDFTAAWVADHVPALLDDPDALRAIGDKAWRYGIRDAADRMARRIERIAR